jgi:hypothetical protein
MKAASAVAAIASAADGINVDNDDHADDDDDDAADDDDDDDDRSHDGSDDVMTESSNCRSDEEAKNPDLEGDLMCAGRTGNDAMVVNPGFGLMFLVGDIVMRMPEPLCGANGELLR